MCGERLPQEDVAVDVEEGAILKAVGYELADGPPVDGDVFETIEFGGYFCEGEAELIDQQALAWGVGDENGLGGVGAGGVAEAPPRAAMMGGLSPAKPLLGPECHCSRQHHGAPQFFFR